MKKLRGIKVLSKQELEKKYDQFEQKITNRILELPKSMQKKYEDMTDYEWEKFLENAYDKELRNMVIGL